MTTPTTDEETLQANTQANSRRSLSSSFRKILLPGPTSNPSQPRRSIAHSRSLLGYDAESHVRPSSSAPAPIQETSTDWHDVELEFDAESELAGRSTTRTHTRRDSIPLRALPQSDDAYSYRIDEDEEKVFSTPHSYGTRDDQYDEEDEHENVRQQTSAYTPLTAPSYPYNDDDNTTPSKLDFESLTMSEKVSYWVTAVLVLALSIVAIGIGSDWIDWPGDGIGKD